jgi:hypothetical protein
VIEPQVMLLHTGRFPLRLRQRRPKSLGAAISSTPNPTALGFQP